ncbi:diguanylate cyclase [Bacillus sp. CGMCC 1.16541]|uniref:GGDEF domain-containing protein n=1 Tax=Bacillus sp. CGMCC 1.16541 TaxID=2185143 RepID=UPI0013A5A5C6|nr:diguanylate cyclase [Bacillus sp. CGMCC 1.16541]
MFHQLLFNVTLIITFLFVFHLVRERIKETKFLSVHRWVRIVLLGSSFGILGVVLMIYTIRVDQYIIADLRHLATVIVAAYAGFWPAVLSAIIIAIGRIALFGISSASLVAALFMLFIGIVCGVISMRSITLTKKFHVMNGVSLLLILISLSLNIRVFEKVLSIFTYHALFSIVGGFFVFQVGKYLYQSAAAAERHRNLAKMFSVLIQNAHTAVMIETANRRVAVVNQAFCDMFQLEGPPKQMVGRNSGRLYEKHQYVVKNSSRFIKRLDEIMKKNQVVEGEEFTFVDGKIYTLDYVPIYERNTYIGHYWEYRDVTKRREAEEKLMKLNGELQQLSNRDGLTKLANRRALDERLKVEWEYAILKKHSLSFILFDLDYFKAYNDTYGHLAGDDCLERVGRTVQEAVRAAICVARYGGEEFAVVLPRVTKKEVLRIAETIRVSIHNLRIPHEASPISEYVTVSVGVATVKPTEQDAMLCLIDAADRALYEAKDRGRNRVRVANDKRRSVKIEKPAKGNGWDIS